MKTTTIRVTRTQKLTVTETVEVPVIHENDDFPGPTDKALALVKALDDAGHDVDWRVVSEVADAYAHNTTWKTETVSEVTSE